MKSFLFLFILFVLTSCNNSTTYIKSEALKKQIQLFTKDAHKYSPFVFKDCDTVMVRFSPNGEIFKVSFDYFKPSSLDNIYAVVEESKMVVFFYSNINISSYVFSKNPYIVDTNKIVLEHYSKFEEIDWYSDLFYFDGISFWRDTIPVNYRTPELK